MHQFPSQKIDEETVRKAAIRRVKDEKEANDHQAAMKKTNYSAATREQLGALGNAINLVKPEDARDTSTRVVWSSKDGKHNVCDLRTFLDHMNSEVGNEFNTKSMAVLRDAYYPWSNNGPVLNEHTSPKMITLYEKLFQDMIKHSETWSLFW
eukprot:CAMPEP_0119046376 /NCGR_PEP_ID=MMETSP1177-20130426/46202_1 /TAXON_ID=2985 /ORGANISM="Ochromonas sp, Strain CCMP1899" /LENGTH=151 /DNA_ID=CAMNT_0007019447 /DNA_START=54 /DNA_END=506 /DNA_ORIENTATION=-